MGRAVFRINYRKKESGACMTEERLAELQKIPRERVRSFLEQVNNPYAQNVGEYILQVGYMDGAQETLEERMVTLARKQAEVL